MTLAAIDEEIKNRKEELVDLEQKEGYEYVIKFMENNKLDNILDFITLDIWEFLKCFLYSCCGKKNINDYISIVEEYKDIFDKLNPEEVNDFFITVGKYKESNNMDEIIEYFNKKGLVKPLTKINLIADDKKEIIKLALFKKKIDSNRIDLIPFLEAVDEDSEWFVEGFVLYSIYRKIKSFLSNKVFEVYVSSNDEKELKEARIRTLKKALSDDYNVDLIVSTIGFIKNYKEGFERVERNNQREISGIDNAREFLGRELDKKQIIRYREIIKGIKNPKIMYMFLKYIKEHNDYYLNELEEELDGLKQNTKVATQALLNDYGIKKDSYDYDSLPKYTKEELEKILKLLSRIDINNEEKIRIIKSTSIDKINTLTSYLDREIIPKEFISKNTYILDDNSNELDNLKENIETLKRFNISISVFTNSINVVMNDPSFISNNLNILSSYNLLLPLSSTTNLNFLLNDNLETIIDKYLELGYENYLENDLELLNKKELERLEVLKVIGIPITSREELEYYLNEDKEFFISKDEINNYITNDSIYFDEPEEVVTIDKLEEYKLNRVYDFNGTKISIEKINRLLKNNYSLYQAIISNTNLCEEELLNIINIISNEKGKELKKVSY